MEFFQKFGSLVSQRWKSKNYNEEVFAELASDALAELPPAQHVSPWDVVKWAMTVDQLPYQYDIGARFGNPPLTVYAGRKFRIEVLFWTSGLPSIHQHGFSGAFHVMDGSSIHSLWDFRPQEQFEARLVLGHVSFLRSEILQKGNSRAILGGSSMFHSTFHLDRPSISVVVRTLAEPDKQPQYELHPPTIAEAPMDEVPTVKRQVQLLRMLLMTGQRGELNEILRHLCATKDAYTLYHLLRSAYVAIEDEEERESLLLIAGIRQAKLVDALRPVLERDVAEHRLHRIYETASSADQKFFLALLRNVPERAAILGLIRQRFPGRDPVASIVHWVRELSISHASTIRFDEPALLMLECLLMNKSVRTTQDAFREKYPDVPPPRTEELDDLCTRLQASWFLQSLELKSPFAPKERPCDVALAGCA